MDKQQIIKSISSEWEKSGRDLSGEEVEGLLEGSGVSLDELIDGKDVIFDGTGHVMWVDVKCEI